MRNTNSISFYSRVLDKVLVGGLPRFISVKLLVKSGVALGALLLSQTLFAATCKYEIVNDWNTGFQAKVSIINDAPEPINNWEVSWAWSDGSTLENGWNATYDCNASACSATGPAWAINVGANQTYEFGFNGKNGSSDVPADTSVVINGDACDPPDAPPIPPTKNETAAMLVPILALLLDEPSPAKSFWKLDGAQSNIQYVSVKNSHKAEANSFTKGTDDLSALNGSIDSDGNAVLSIDLNDVETSIDVRNQRIRDFVFETQLLPTAFISVKLDPEALSSMSVGSVNTQNVTGKLTLHGVSQDVVAEVLVAKTSETSLVVSTIKPILIDSKNFDFASGIEVLRAIANLSSIGEVVPVYFRLHYGVNTNPSASPLTIGSKPAAPTALSAQYNVTSSNALLNWQDNSTNESGFIVRRRLDSGLWNTVANVLTNVSTHSESLANAGAYEYKVISVNNGIPSAASNVASIVVNPSDPNDPSDPTDPDGDPVAGKNIYDQQCASCHGAAGEGIGSFPALNTPRDIPTMSAYIAQNMPLGSAGECNQECADDVSKYIESFWGDGGGPNPDVTACLADAPTSYGARQLKILTRSEYQRSVEDLLGVNFDAASGLSEDDKIGLFANNTHASVVSSSYSNYLLVAEQIAEWSEARDFAPALNCSTFDQGCADTFISQFAPRIFRRPLNSAELDTYNNMADGTLTEGDVKAGIALALEAMLSAPQFLYRHELGEPNPNNPDLDSDAFELTSHEMATFLAYTFTGSTPDQALLNAANNDLLRTESEILAQAQRLSEAAAAKDVMGDFVGSWLGTSDLDIAAKDPATWPGFDSLVPHMKNEIRENFSSVMLDRNETFSSIYNPSFSYLNQTLAQHYGIAGVAGNEMRRVTTTNRGGVLANGAFMARWGEAVETSPIIRSVRVRRRMLCQDELPNPPAGTFAAREERLAELAEILRDPTTTNRRKNHLLTEGPPCSSCHLEYINPLGFGMEDFDTVGKLRLNDLNGNTVDATGQLFAPNDYSDISQIEPFTGAKGLAQLVSSLPSAQSCLSEQMFRYVIGVGHENIDVSNPEGPGLAVEEKQGYACEIENLTNEMMESSPRAMFERFSTLEAVRYRKAWSRD